MPNSGPYLWKTDKFYGGESDDERVGRNPGSSRYLCGFDIYSSTGKLSVAKRPVLHNDIDITKTIKWIEPHPTNGDVYMYGENTIYKETAGAYSIVREIASGTPNGEGLCDFDNYLYYRWDDKLGRFDYNATWTDNWQSGLQVTEFSPMHRFKNFMLVGHGRYVGTVDDVGFWSATRLTLPPSYTVRKFFTVGRYVVILAIRGTTITGSDEGYLFFWNGTSQNYDDVIPLLGNPHAGAAVNNKIMLISGERPVIQITQGGSTDDRHTLPDVAIGHTAEVWPGAIDVWNKKVYFGISAGTSPDVLRVVRGWGAKNSAMPDACNPEFPISTGTLTGTGLQITAVKKVGTSLRYAWVDGVDKGIDQVDLTQVQATAKLRSLAWDNETPYDKIPSDLVVELTRPLADGESVTIKVGNEPYSDPKFTNTATYTSMQVTSANVLPEGGRLIRIPLSTTHIRSRDLHYEVSVVGDVEIKRIWTAIAEANDTI